MASSKINPNRENEEIGSDIPDFPSKIPGKLVYSKRAKTGKLNLHLVSSTPMNPAKRANFFDESNQFRSPIKSGGSSTEVNTNSPDNKIKILKSVQNTKKNMLNEENPVGTSPFPFFTKLAVKKMTICASDEDSDDNIFVKPKITKTNNKLIIDTDEEFSSDSSDSEKVDEINLKKTEAVIEFVRKDSTDEETNDQFEKTLNKTATIKLVDVNANKNALKTTKMTKSIEENKENVNIKITDVKTKSKSQPVEKNMKNRKTDNKNKSDLDSSKQRKSNENIVQRKKNENMAINSEEATNNKTLTLRNNVTKIKIAKKSMNVGENGLRKSSRSCQSTIPYWMSPWNKENVTDVLGNSIMSVTGTKRPRTAPETVTKRKGSTKVEAKSENTVILNKTKTKPKSEPPKENNKTISTKENVKNITLIKSISEPEKDLVEESLKPITRSNKNKSILVDEVFETSKNVNISKTKEVEKKTKESQKNVLKSSGNDKNTTQLKETVSNVQDNRKRQYSKEKLDKENKEKKNNVENITAKLKAASPTKFNSNLRDSVRQSVVENGVFEPEIDDLSSTLINNDTTVKKSSKINSKREDVHGLFEIPSPPRTSKRIIDKNKKQTNNIVYTPGIALKENKNDLKSIRKRRVVSNEKSKEDKNLRSRTFNKRKLNKYVDELEKNDTESKDLLNSESSNENGITQSLMRKRRFKEIKPVKKRTKKTITTGSNRKRAFKNTKQSRKSSKQVNFNENNVNDTDMNNTFESDSLSSYENPSKMSCKASYSYKTNPPRQFSRPRDSRYSRKTLFYQPEMSGHRRSRYVANDSTLEDTDSLSSEEIYMPMTKKRKYKYRGDYKKRKVDHSCHLNFKEKAIAVQVPISTHTLTEVQHRGKTMMMECFGNFPKKMTKINEQSSLRGTCFMNDLFAAGVMEITLGTIKKCNASNNHTYFVVLDGIAEIGIGDSAKILRIGDCCIVPKHTFYYVANASSEVNLLLNFLKVSL